MRSSSRPALTALLAALALGPGAGRAEPADALAGAEQAHQALFEKVAPSVVVLSRGGSLGSGFFVRRDGLLLTNAHVVGEEAKIQVVLRDGRRLDGTVVERAAGNVDLALVQVPAEGPALELDGTADVRVGSFVAAVGHGEGTRGGLWTFSAGMVSNIHPVGAEWPVLQTQIPLNPGSSGAPVVDRRGRVVGVVTAGIQAANAINYAIRADVALRSLSRLSAAAGYLVVLAPAGATVFVDGVHAGVGPRVAIPARPGKREVLVVAGSRMERRLLDFPKEATVEVK